MSGTPMADVINWNKAAKKARKRCEDANAALNRRVHGRTKAERALEQARRAKAERDLAQHRIETGERS